jgi:hypothetical protein
MTQDLNTMTKAELNAMLAAPLTALALKKKAHADLVAMFDAMPATDALDADLRDARADDPTPTDPVLDDSEYLTPTKKTAPTTRTVEDRVLVQPTTDPDKIRPIRAGTKRHLMAVALARGTTLEHLAEVTGWRRDVVSSALYTDFKAAGLGIERKAGKLHLILPEGVKRLPVREAATSNQDTIAACK